MPLSSAALTLSSGIFEVTACTRPSSSIEYSLPTECQSLWSMSSLVQADATIDTRYTFFRYYHATQVISQNIAAVAATLLPDQARCIPPITVSTQCPFEYAHGPCPNGFVGANTIVQAGTSTAICCPNVSGIQSWSVSSTWNIFQTGGDLTGSIVSHTVDNCWGVMEENTSSFVYAFNDSTSTVESFGAQYPPTFYVPALQMTYTTADTQATASLNTGVSAFPGSIITSAVKATTTPNLSSATPTTTPVSTSSENTLSAGAKAGISVGVILGVLAGFVACLLLWRKNSKKKEQTNDRDTEHWIKAELPGDHVDKTKGLIEVDGAPQIHQLDATPKPAEISAVSSPVEMAA